jgi:peptidylprolyl isomerase
MQSSDLPTTPTDPGAEPPTEKAPVTGQDSPAPVPTEPKVAATTPLPKSEASAEEPAAEPTAETAAEATPDAAAETTPDAEPAPETDPETTPVAAEPVAAAAVTRPVVQPTPKKPRPTPPPAPASSNGRKAVVAVGVIALIAVAAGGIFLVAPKEDKAPVAAQPSAAAPSEAATPAASSAAAAVPATGDINTVKVTGTDKPTVTLATPFAVAKTSTRILTPGTGKELALGESVTIDYLGVNGTSGKTFDTSYGKPDPVSFLVGDKNLIKGMMDGLTGVKVGSRVLLAIPAVDGYGTKGAPDAGIGPNDTLLFVIDVKSATKPLTRATGTAVAPKAGLPTVTLAGNGAPTITVPKTPAPAALVIQPLIQGTGAVVAKGQSITVNYTGAVWASGKVFDSSWTNGAPATFSIGTGAVIPGWDKGLVGQKVGSQVLLSIPPADGYGATGQSSAGISGTDTLVFVVDILAAS